MAGYPPRYPQPRARHGSERSLRRLVVSLTSGSAFVEQFYLDEIVDVRSPEGDILRGRIDYIEERTSLFDDL
jgi:hypothetical protein